jgi:hypothetical protein
MNDESLPKPLLDRPSPELKEVVGDMMEENSELLLLLLLL